MDQQFSLRFGLGFGRAAKDGINAAGKIYFGRNLFFRLVDKRGHIAPGGAARDGLPAARPFVENGVASAGGIDFRQLAERNPVPLGAAQQERADRFRVLPIGLV